MSQASGNGPFLRKGNNSSSSVVSGRQRLVDLDDEEGVS
jgi:hypothetical protein